MSALFPSDRGRYWTPPTDACFFCSTDVGDQDAAVMWAGHQEILLHPDCATRLGTHLITDSREAQLGSGFHPWSRRAARLVRETLVSQEGRR
jgi:hypothetical protein